MLCVCVCVCAAGGTLARVFFKIFFFVLCGAGGTLAKVFMTPITVISAAVDTLKLMFPLMMITVPICYVRSFAPSPSPIPVCGVDEGVHVRVER